MFEKNNPKKPQLGYLYATDNSTDTLGASRLDVFILETPTEHHFDPEKLQCSVKAAQNAVELLTIQHPWTLETDYQVLAGSITITDRLGKEEEAFTFGGRLKIDPQETVTICILESPAPILEISAADSTMMMFIEEIEILFAQQRAALLSQPNSYENHLINVDPFTLYQAIVETLIEKFEHSHHKEDISIQEFLDLLHTESKRLKELDKAPLYVPSLKDLFSA